MRLLRLLTNYLPYWILLAGILGYLFPNTAASSDFLVPWLLFIMILGLGLTLNFSDFKRVLRWKEVLGALSLQLIIIPATALFFSLAFPAGSLRDGIFVLGLVPAEITSPLLATLAGGELSLSTILLVLSLLISTLIIPFVAGTQAAVSLTVELLLSVLLPLVIGIIVRTRFWRPDRELCNSLSAVALIGLIFVACASLRTVGLLPFVMLVGLALVIVAVDFGWGMLVGRLVGATGGRFVSLVFFSGMREFGVAVAIAVSTYPKGAALAAAIYGPVMIFVAGVIAFLSKNRSSSLRRSVDSDKKGHGTTMNPPLKENK